MPKPYPQGFREDVVVVARSRGPGVTLKSIAEDFGIAEASLLIWLKRTDIKDGKRPGHALDEATEMRQLRRRKRLLEQVR